MIIDMTLGEIRTILNAVVLAGEEDMDRKVDGAFSADLMSDVLSYSITNSVLITGLTNAQVVRSAEVADIGAIVFIQGKRPDMQTVDLADQKKIALLATDISMFDSCGMLYQRGLRGLSSSSNES